MNKLYLLLIAVLFAFQANTQTSILFHEDFELPSSGDSLQSSSNPAGATAWQLSTGLKYSGLYSDSVAISPSTITYLTSNSFSTSGYSNVMLKFAQICKIINTDSAYIQYSLDGGLSWTRINPAYYRGNGIIGSNGFNENSYSSSWLVGDTISSPNNNWWKYETFDLSSLIANNADVKIRFCISDGGITGGEGRFGWLLDDIQVVAANNEMYAPIISFANPVLSDTVYVNQNLKVNVYIKDSSAIASANLNYSVNGGSIVTLSMTNVSDSLYSVSLPVFPYNSIICYSIQATDIYNNSTPLPYTGCKQFLILKGNTTVQIGTATTTSYYSPFYINSSSSEYLYSNYVCILKKEEIKSGGLIESIAFNKTDVNGYILNNATMRIYIKNTSVATLPSSIYNFNYANEKSTATKIYESTTQNIPKKIGWQTYNCNTGSLFSYTGNENLMVIVEFYHPGNATGPINWEYTSTQGCSFSFYGSNSNPTSNISNYRANIKIAFESGTSTIDSKVSEFTTPSNSVNANTSIPVSVKIKNLGTSTLTSANIKWSVDGIYQGVISWNDTLNQDYTSQSIQLGNYSFTPGQHFIKAWTENPNNATDQNVANDTSTLSLYSCLNLSGTYTVGNSTADFSSFSDLFTAIDICGISGPLTIKIKSGTYNQQLNIPSLRNASGINTVTFESETGNRDDVLFLNNTTNSLNYVLNITSNFVKIKNISFKSTNQYYGSIIKLSNAYNNIIEGCKLEMPVATNSNNIGISTSAASKYNIFKNNIILNGYYGVCFMNNYSNSNIFDGNVISGAQIYGMYFYSVDSIVLKNNAVTNSIGINSGGIYVNYTNNSSFIKNKIEMSSTNSIFCLYLGYSNNCLIANNFLSQYNGLIDFGGINLYSSTNIKVFNNSVNITKGTSISSSVGFYSCLGINLYNNILVNTGGGFVLTKTSNSTIDSSNYNNFYSTITYSFSWDNTNKHLNEIINVFGKEKNSLITNPQFYSTTDLHTNSVFLGRKGKRLIEITDDIDGEIRDTLPCIGADEFTVPQNDAGISKINILDKITILNQNIKATIQNLGQLPLTSAIVKCSINGTMLPDYNYNGNIPFNGVDSVVIGNYTFNPGLSKIKVWTEMPNNSSDIYSSNDTLTKTIYSCTSPLSGTFSIGASSADFPTINSAVQYLILCGVGGPVTFNIAPGTYTEQITIPYINGSSATNTITFKSANNDSSSVILNYAANAAANWIVKLNGVSYLTLKNLKFAPADSANSTAILLASNNISFIGNHFIGYYGTADNQILINSSGYGNIFNANRFEKAYIGLKSIASTTISNNMFLDFIAYGIYGPSAYGFTIDSNTLISAKSSTTKYGIYLSNAYNHTINKNTINISGSTNNYGIYIYYCSATQGIKGNIINNTISVNGLTSDSYGILLSSTNYFNVYHNSINVNGNNENNACCIYLTSGSNNELINNNLQSNKITLKIWNTPLSLSNNNNFYSTGSNLAYIGSTYYTTLNALITASQKDSNSISVNPMYISFTDLHINNTYLFNTGSYLSNVTTDIDGQSRSNPPCIGADEIPPPQINASLLEILSPLGGCGKTSTETVKVVIKNAGSVPLNANTYSLSFIKSKGIPSIPETVDRIILPGDTIHYTFNSKVDVSALTAHKDTVFNIKSWVDISGDYAHANDTSSKSVYSIYTPPTPSVQDVTIPFASSTLISVTSLDSLYWFTQAIGGISFFKGKVFQTPVLYDTTTYYVESKLSNPEIVQIGTGTSYQNFPFNIYYGYSRSASVYTAAEIGAYGLIKEIQYQVYAASATASPIKIYMKVVSSASMINQDWTSLTSDAVLVYEGIAAFNLSGWNSITLNTIFDFTPGNLMILCESNYGGGGSSYTYPYFNYTTTSLSGTHQYANQDSYAPTGNLSLNNSRPNVKLKFASANCSSPRVPVNVNVAIYSQEVGLSSISTPSGCALDMVPVTISIVNNGSDTINDNITASYKFKNGDFITPEQVTIPIPPFDTIQYTFNTLANLFAPNSDTIFKITAVVNLLNDPYAINDTLTKDSILSRFTPVSPITSTVNIPYGASATLTATSPNTLVWYNELTGGNILGQGTLFTPPLLYTTDTFYVQATINLLSTLSFGTGTSTNTNTGYPAPYGNYFKGAKHQILITKAELNANGFTGGSINSLAFDVATVQGTALQNFEIKMGHTPLSTLTVGNWITNTIPVYSAATYTDILGWNTHQFSTPFIWNGTDNLIVEICFNNTGFTNNAKTRYTPTSFNSVAYKSGDITDLCTGTTSASVSTYRPNIRLQTSISGCSSPRVAAIITVGPPPQNDAGISELFSPHSVAKYGEATAVKFKIKNYGLDSLTNATIAWSLNGVNKPVYNFTGNILPGSDSIITISNEYFTVGQNCIKAWTYNPNGVLDSVNSNDTLFNTCFTSCMIGDYTIGDTTGGNFHNFPTFNAAINTLKLSGVCGNVTLLVDSGTYNEQVRIPEIMGAGTNSMITFRSASNDSTKVILLYASSDYATNYTLKLDSADYIRIEKMTLKSTGSTYGNVIELANSANYNIISNNIIQMPSATTSYYAGIYENNNSNSFNKYQFNEISNGYYGIQSNGNSTPSKKGIEIKGNIIRNFYYYGIYANYHDSLTIADNIITSSSGNYYVYGILAAQVNNASSIIRNKITLSSFGSQYGINLSGCYGTTTLTGLTANNMISLNGTGTSSDLFGIYLYYGSFQNVYFNSVNISAPALENCKAMHVNYGSDYKLLNNNFVNNGGGYALYVYPTSAVTQSDNNNLFTTGTKLTNWNGYRNSLEAHRLASGKDSNSVCLNPVYFSQTDLHIKSPELFYNGKPISGLTKDFDGDLRKPLPTIGADEGNLCPVDISINSIISPDSAETEADTIPVTIAIKNYGTDTIFSVPFSYSINNETPVNYVFNKTIPPLKSDTVYLPNLLVKAGNSNLCINNELVNDTNTFNNQKCKSFWGNPLYDPQLVKILPLIEGCNLTTDTVILLIKNKGVKTINNGLYASYQRIGEDIITTESVNISINPGDSIYFAFQTPVDLSVTTQDSNYQIKSWVSISTDFIHTNDTAVINAKSNASPPLPLVNNANIPYATSALLSATSITNDSIYWYNQPTGGDFISKGNIFNTPLLIENDTFYVSARNEQTINTAVGNGTYKNSWNSYPSPYGLYYKGAKQQYLYKASELTAAGITAGALYSIAFDVYYKADYALDEYTIKIGSTTQSALSSWITTGLTTKYYSPSYTSFNGWNEHSFSTPYIWDGVSNIVIEVCHNNYYGSASSNATVNQTSTTYVSSLYYYSNSDLNICNPGIGSPYASTYRPNIKVNGTIASCPTLRIPVIVTVGNQQTTDIGITQITSPNSAYNTNNQRPVTVSIKNYGSDAISNFTINYQKDNDSIISQLITDTLPSNNTITKTFNQFLNLSESTVTYNYTLKSWTSAINDTNNLNDTIQKSLTYSLPTYCISAPTSQIVFDIVSVTIGTNTNTSLPTGNKYSDFSSAILNNIQVGNNYPVSIKTNYVPTNTTQYPSWVNIFIDYNKDGIFDTSATGGERVFSSANQSFSTINGNITIANTAISGLTRMRVVCTMYGNISNTGPCGIYGNGETEDYTVKITKLPPVNNGSITGNSNACPKQSNVIYSVPAMTYATSYVWTLPSGFTGSSTTNTISVKMESFAQSGIISVKGVNAYGESTSSDFNVIVNPMPVSGLPASLMICSAGQLSANPGYTYLWSTGATSQSITVNQTGWYSCTLNNGYCGTKDSTYVTVDNIPKFNCELRNDEQTSPTTYEFDIYLLNTKDCTPLEYASGAFGILLNPAVKNGGNIVAAIIANSSELNTSQIPSAAAFTASQNCIKIAAKAVPGAGNGTIIPATGSGKRVCRIRLTNSVPFGSAKPDLSWTFTTLPYQSKINAYVGLVNTLLTSDTSTHTVHHLNNQLFKGIVAPSSVITDRNNLCANDTGTIVLSAIGGSGNILRWFKDSCGGNSIGSGISLTLPSPNITTTYYARWEMGVNLTSCASVTINVSPVITASVSISTDSNLVYQNSSITFTANIQNGGSNPLIQWYKNNQLIANENGLTYSYPANNMDSVYCLLTSSLNGCLLEQTVVSNIIGITTLSSAKQLDIKLYLEGFYNASTQQMNPVMNEVGAQYSEYICDSINLLLATANSPYLIEHSFGAKLKTDGSLIATIPYTISGNYYIVIKHRNHLETWSSSPVSFTADTVSYNFTTAISQAYGDNQKQIALTKYAIMVGDVNQDGVVDISDLVAMDYDLTDGTVAYIVYDLNGDGVVDISDLVAIDENITNGAVVITP